MTLSRSLRAAALVAACGAVTLTACSSGGSTAQRHDAVASLPSTGTGTGTGTGTTGTAPSATSAAPRPRSKLFETEQETEADLVPYDNCMRAHGVPVEQGKPRNREGIDVRAYERADAQCADKQPLPPIEEDASNPKALGFNRAVAACIRSHGATSVSVVTQDGVVSVSFDDEQSITIGLEYADSCRRTVAARSH